MTARTHTVAVKLEPDTSLIIDAARVISRHMASLAGELEALRLNGTDDTDDTGARMRHDLLGARAITAAADKLDTYRHDIGWSPDELAKLAIQAALEAAAETTP